MKISIIIFVLITSTFSSVANEIDSNYLIGVWGNSEDGGKTIWGYDQYFSDGSFKSWGEIPQPPIKYELEGTYKVKHKFKSSSCLTISKTSDPEIMPIGEHWCDEIIELNDKVFLFKSSDGEITTLYRQDL